MTSAGLNTGIKVASDQLRKRIEGWLNREAGRRTGRLYATRLGTAVGTTIGRRAENQDRCLIMTASFPKTPERDFVLAAVCDGMGGMAHGGAYASLALGAFVASVVHGVDEAPDARLMAAVGKANDAVHDDQTGHGGATLSAVFAAPDSGITAVNVGDSRIYGVDADSKLTQLTTDDTLAAHLSALRGGDHSDIPKGDQLVQYIGMGPGLEPHIIPIDADEPPDHLLITSDGAHYFDQDVMQRVLGAAEDAEEAVGRLMTLSEWLGGRDNAAAIMAPVGGLTAFAPDNPPDHDLIEIWGPFGKVEFLDDARLGARVAAGKTKKTPSRPSAKKARKKVPAKTARGKTAAEKIGGGDATANDIASNGKGADEKTATPKTTARKSAASTPTETKSTIEVAPYTPKTGSAKAAPPKKPAAKKSSGGKRASRGKTASGSGLSIKISGA